MTKQLRSVLIIANTGKAGAYTIADEISDSLRRRNVEVTRFFYEGAADEVPFKDGHDLAITLGGDGTVLFASRVLAGHAVPILPVNLGDFGFISEVARDEWEEALDAYIRGDIMAGPRLVLDVCVCRGDEDLCAFRGLNDAVVSCDGISRMVRLDVSVSGQHIGKYRADGVIVATPTGSTAYSVAAGGPILHPEMDAMILNPICPFTLSHRPLVLPANEEILITVDQHQRAGVALTVDGQSLTSLEPGDCVRVKASDRRAHIIRSNRRTFYEVLRNKLNWSGGPGD
ncbi:MAG: NAD(+)/NADH kinase [Alkalispirochaeta sp.]|jgi:NAD+ kinase